MLTIFFWIKNVSVRKPRYVRVNTLIMSVDQAINGFIEEGWNLLPPSENYSSFLETLSNLEESMFLQDFHIPELLIFPHGTAFFNHPGYKTGEIILQDKVLRIKKIRNSLFIIFVEKFLK